MIKDGWRNHVMHLSEKYTEPEAQAIYDSSSAFMRHLSRQAFRVTRLRVTLVVCMPRLHTEKTPSMVLVVTSIGHEPRKTQRRDREQEGTMGSGKPNQTA
jgi:hypothetical protein